MNLAILTATIPEREESLNKLKEHLANQIKGKEMFCSHLIFKSNKGEFKIGDVRQRLLDLAEASNAEYIVFVDDDDWVSGDFVDKVLHITLGTKPDLIVYNQGCEVDGRKFTVHFGKDFSFDQEVKDGELMFRPPNHSCVWKTEIAIQSKFPSKNYGEDYEWSLPLIPFVRNQARIFNTLHFYTHSKDGGHAKIDAKRCVVNFAKGEWYEAGQRRLFESLEKHKGEKDFDIFLYQKEEQLNCPAHVDNPYAFKIYAIMKAHEMGYNQVLWLDASMYAVKNIDQLWNEIEENGHLFEEAGHWTGTWCNDNALKYFGLNREEAMKIPMFSAGMMGLDLRSETSFDFMHRLNDACRAGAFKGSWTDHRHDMTCASILAHERKMKYTRGGTYLSYIGDCYAEPSETSILHLKGI